LYCRITTAYEKNVFPSRTDRFGASGPVVHATPNEFTGAGILETAPVHARRNHHGAGVDLAALAEVYVVAPSGTRNRGYIACHEKLCTKALRL
jgi:hypothetical protein